MKHSIINYKIVDENDNFRLDAEFYYPDYLIYSKQIRKHEVYYLTKILHPTEIKRVYCKKGIQILLAQNVRNNELNFSNIVFMDESKKNDLKRNKLYYDDVVLTRSGANFGQSSSFKLNKDIYACADVLIIKNTNEIKGGYLSTFLNSKQGKALLNRGSYGMAQPHIAPSYLYKLPVPRFNIFFEEKIDQLINKSGTVKMHALKCYFQARQILLAELGLQDWKPKHKLTVGKNYSDTKVSGRIDAEYFQPKYNEIIKKFNNCKCVKLDNVCELIGHPSNPPYTSEGDKDKTFIVTQKHLGYYYLSDGFWLDDDALYSTKDFINKNKKYLLKKNDILIYSVGAYIGKANIYTSDVKAILGSFLTLIRLKEDSINPYYLLVLLNTNIGIMLSKRNQRGMAQQYLYPYDIKEFLIPIIDENTQRKIESTLIQAKTKISISKALLDISKKGVEMAIEKDENIAEEWIKKEVDKLGVKINA